MIGRKKTTALFFGFLAACCMLFGALSPSYVRAVTSSSEETSGSSETGAVQPPDGDPDADSQKAAEDAAAKKAAEEAAAQKAAEDAAAKKAASDAAAKKAASDAAAKKAASDAAAKKAAGEAAAREAAREAAAADTSDAPLSSVASSSSLASSLPAAPSSSAIVLPGVSAVSEADPLASAAENNASSRQMKLYGILAWACIALGVAVVLIVVLSNRRPPRGPGRSRYHRPKRGGKHLLDDKYYRDVNRY